jgi:hypothetical protein
VASAQGASEVFEDGGANLDHIEIDMFDAADAACTGDGSIPSDVHQLFELTVQSTTAGVALQPGVYTIDTTTTDFNDGEIFTVTNGVPSPGALVETGTVTLTEVDATHFAGQFSVGVDPGWFSVDGGTSPLTGTFSVPNCAAIH